MTMIERVARNLAMLGGDDDHWFHYIDAAKWAILAMREPTEEMMEAASSILCKIADDAEYESAYLGDFESARDAARVIWATMIDAALQCEEAGK